MKNNEADQTLKKICPTCGKRIAGGRRSGSLTAYLFGASDCACWCDRNSPKPSQAASKGHFGDDSAFCPKCGLQIVTDSKDGTLTGFMFQSTRCKCAPDQAFADGKMSTKFRQLQQAGSGTIFLSATNEPGRGTVSSVNLAPGATIGGVYKIVALIGRGGMGEVYLARHETLGKKCALKVIPPEQVTEMGWQRFQLEARAVAKLDHVNLVRVTDLGIHEGCLPFYAMDFVEGKNLAELLAEHGPMPLRTMLEIFMQVCDGIETAHRSGLMHRDLKPANIMVSTSGSGNKQAKVLDFGLAKLISHDRTRQSLTAVGDIFGSPLYMSPEQCGGAKLDNRSDIYSLGCTMFECLTARPPFEGNLASAVCFSHMEADPPSLETIVGPNRFPASMEVVIAKLLRKNPAERYQTMSQLKADLELVAEGKDVQPVYVSRDKKSVPVQSEDFATAPSSSERPHMLLLALGSVVLLFLAGYLFYYFSSHLFYSGQTSTKTGSVSKSDATHGKETASKVAGEEEMAGREGSSPPFFAHKTADGATIFVFPKEEGTKSTWSLDGIDYKPVNGPAYVPAGGRLFFKAGEAFAYHPQLLGAFAPDDLTGLTLTRYRGWNNDHFAEIAKLKSLKYLGLAGVTLKKVDLKRLNQLPNLMELNIDQTDLQGADMAQLFLLRRLYKLEADELEVMSPLLEKLQNNTAILSLSMKGCGLTDADLELIGKMHNLQALCIDDNPVSFVGFKSLVDLRRLQTLRVGRLAIGPEAIDVLHNYKFLKHLRISTKTWSIADKDRLTRALPPRCVLESPEP